MTSAQHDNLWAITSAIAIGLAGWGLVKVPIRWYVAATTSVMCILWGVLVLWALGSSNHSIELRLRSAHGLLSLFEFVLGPIVALFLGVAGLLKKKDTAKRTFVINQCLVWSYVCLTFGFWSLMLWAALSGHD